MSRVSREPGTEIEIAWTMTEEAGETSYRLLPPNDDLFLIDWATEVPYRPGDEAGLPVTVILGSRRSGKRTIHIHRGRWSAPTVRTVSENNMVTVSEFRFVGAEMHRLLAGDVDRAFKGPAR